MNALEYRGVRAGWSGVYQCYRFTLRSAGRQEVHGVPTEAEFRRLVDQLTARGESEATQ